LRPDAIFFDLGMVLVTFDWKIALARFADRNGGDPGRAKRFLTLPQHDAFERNELSGDEFYQLGREEMGFTGSAAEMEQSWSEIFDEIPQTVRLLRELAETYPVYALSNTNPWHARYLESRYDWMNLFSQRFYSCTFGIRKPDTRLYELACASANVKPIRALFIDDRQENIEGAQKIGMNTILAVDSRQLKTDLSTLLSKTQDPTAVRIG